MRAIRRGFGSHGLPPIDSGDCYRHAWFDDGTPLGSADNSECRIDSISQGWAVLSGVGDTERARMAMGAVDERLEMNGPHVAPLLPAHWTGLKIHYRYRETVDHNAITQT